MLLIALVCDICGVAITKLLIYNISAWSYDLEILSAVINFRQLQVVLNHLKFIIEGGALVIKIRKNIFERGMARENVPI